MLLMFILGVVFDVFFASNVSFAQNVVLWNVLDDVWTVSHLLDWFWFWFWKSLEMVGR
jgi:hypothetical protein